MAGRPKKKQETIRKLAGKRFPKKAEPAKEEVKAYPITGFQPPPAADEVANARAMAPKGGLSPGMESILFGDWVLIVKTPKGGVTNREEFVKEMAHMRIKVVFLEYSIDLPYAPVVERHTR